MGDALWIARHKATTEDFVLDFILERKRADDLWASIKSKRYKDQKLRLQVGHPLCWKPSRFLQALLWEPVVPLGPEPM